eukprot:g14973.t1
MDTEIHQKLYDPLPLGCKSVCLFDCCHSATVANLGETMVVKEGPLTAAAKDALVKRCQAQKDAVQTQVRFYQEDELVKLFEKHSFPKKTGSGDDGSGYSYLLNQKIVAFCTESVQKVEALLAEKEEDLKHAQSLKADRPWNCWWID